MIINIDTSFYFPVPPIDILLSHYFHMGLHWTCTLEGLGWFYLRKVFLKMYHNYSAPNGILDCVLPVPNCICIAKSYSRIKGGCTYVQYTKVELETSVPSRPPKRHMRALGGHG